MFLSVTIEEHNMTRAKSDRASREQLDIQIQ